MTGTEHVRDDSNILALFYDWVDEARRVQALPDQIEDERFFEAVDCESAIQHAIFDIPSTSLRGLAIKVYLQIHHEAIARPAGEYCAVYRDSDADARDDLEAHASNSILDDVVRFAPELAAFVKVRRPDDADRDELGFFKNALPAR